MRAGNGKRASWQRPLRFESLEPRTLLAVSVVSQVETAAFGGEEDDIAIWIHPTDTAQSHVIGTVKTSSSSLAVYNLAGQVLQTVAVPNVNNVDLRYNFSLSGVPTAILAGSNRNSNSIVLYRIDSQTGLLTNVAARNVCHRYRYLRLRDVCQSDDRQILCVRLIRVGSRPTVGTPRRGRRQSRCHAGPKFFGRVASRGAGRGRRAGHALCRRRKRRNLEILG